MYTSSKSSHNSKHMVTIRPANTDQELNAETVAKSYPTSPLLQIWGFSRQENFLLVYDYSIAQYKHNEI